MDTGRSASRAIETEWLCIDVTENMDFMNARHAVHALLSVDKT